MHLGPVRGRGGTQGGQAVAGDALGLNPLLLFSLIERVHDALPLIGPAVLDHAMNEQAIDVVSVEYLAVVVDGREHLVGFAGDFGLDEQLLTRQALDGGPHPLEGAVALRAIEVSDALVVGIMDELVEIRLTQVVLGIPAVAASAEAQAAQFQAGLAKGDLVHRSALGGGLCLEPRPGSQQQGGGCTGGAFKELAAIPWVDFHIVLSAARKPVNAKRSLTLAPLGPPILSLDQSPGIDIIAALAAPLARSVKSVCLFH